mgnify:CR=1 FL=1|tara:strand:+ start:10341 stop:10817 length:477 start_codon:yes stop_codon:yes gene_type:complete
MLKRIIIFFSVILGLVLLSIFYPYLTGERKIIAVDYEKESCFVNRIIDGDTLVCDNETIRLLGIDTPEKGEEYYQEAKDYLMIVNNKEIEILRDWDDLGKYYRKLRYVFYENRLINIELIEQGLAIAYYHEDLKYEEKLLGAEEFARESCFGIWEDDC